MIDYKYLDKTSLLAWNSRKHTFGYVLTINLRDSSIIKIPRANAKGIPQNMPGIGVVEKTFWRP